VLLTHHHLESYQDGKFIEFLEKAVVLFAVMSFDLFHLSEEILLASPVSLAIVTRNVVV
jgi:hypothetical protein